MNRNHFAGFVELVAPVGLALLVFRGVRSDLFPLAGLLTIIPVGALILSGSRGGIVCFGFEVAVLALLARIAKGRGVATMIAIAFVSLASIRTNRLAGRGKSDRAVFENAARRCDALPPCLDVPRCCAYFPGSPPEGCRTWRRLSLFSRLRYRL